MSKTVSLQTTCGRETRYDYIMMKNVLSLLPWVLTAAVVVATPIVLFSGYQPKGHDVTLTPLDSEDLERRAQEFVRKLTKGSTEKSF